MKSKIYDLEGKEVGEKELPDRIFSHEFHPNLIRRAVHAVLTKSLQPKGTKPYAGRNYSAEYVGFRRLPWWRRSINLGRARKPRLKNRKELAFGRVANVPEAVKGPKAHPPKVEKVLIEKINKKEKLKALLSAVSASSNKEIILKRGHVIEKELNFPLIVVKDVENIKKTKDALDVIRSLGLEKDIEKAKERKKIRAGKGKRRGRRYKRKKSILVVLSNKDVPAYRAFKNIEGVDVTSAKDLSVVHLAPGGLAGRLTLWSEKAVDEFIKRVGA